MKNKKFVDAINEVKKTAFYTIPLTTVISCIISFGKWSFYFYLPFLTLVAFAAQFVFEYISFDKIQMSKTKMIMLLIFFVSLAILSFSNIKL